MKKKIVGVNSEFRNVESKGRKKLCKKLNDKNVNIDLFFINCRGIISVSEGIKRNIKRPKWFGLKYNWGGP